MINPATIRDHAFFFFIGVCFVANLLFVPSAESSPRASDAACLALAVLLGYRLMTIRLSRSVVVGLLLIYGYFGIWCIIGYTSGDYSTAIAASRLLLGIAAGLYLSVRILEDNRLWIALSFGAVAGGLIVTTIALGQVLFEDSVFDMVRPSRAPTWWGGHFQIRAIGIWEHPNGLAHAQMVPAAFALVLVANRSMPLFGWILCVLISAGTYAATGTRAALVVLVALVLVCLLVARSRNLRIRAAIIGALCLWAVATFFGDAIEQRWLRPTASGMTLADNASERLESTLGTIDMTLLRPFGWGVKERRDSLEGQYGSSASHNSFLSFGMTFGVFPLVLMLLLPGFVLFRLMSHSQETLHVAIPLFGAMCSFIFEDVIYSPTFLSVLPCLVVLGLLRTNPQLVDSVRVPADSDGRLKLVGHEVTDPG